MKGSKLMLSQDQEATTELRYLSDLFQYNS